MIYQISVDILEGCRAGNIFSKTQAALFVFSATSLGLKQTQWANHHPKGLFFQKVLSTLRQRLKETCKSTNWQQYFLGRIIILSYNDWMNLKFYILIGGKNYCLFKNIITPRSYFKYSSHFFSEITSKRDLNVVFNHYFRWMIK